MKKKLITLLTFVFFVCITPGLVACGTNEDVVEVTAVTFNTNEITLTEGECEILTTTITPADATNQSLEWSSSNPNVATVDYGSVTAIAAGEATITVTTSNGKIATCVVTVVAEEPEPPTQYSVKLNANGGKFDNNRTTLVVKVNEGEKLTNETVTRGDKYIFTGWYLDEYCTKLWNIDEDTVTENTKLYAGWKYLNSYQSVIDALAERIKTERQDNETNVEILLIFVDNGYLCFVEKDSTGVFSYITDICNFDEVKNNAELISEIPNTSLKQLNEYNYPYNSANNSYIADSMAYKYTNAESSNSIVFSCVSEWELDTEHFINNGPWYSCKVKAIGADDFGAVFEYSFKVISGYANFNAVVGGIALSDSFDETTTELGEIANDFYSERLKEKEA